jgi:hypothetical protein
MQPEEIWMNLEKCEEMNGYADALEAYMGNKREMCPE